jgi:hypothetical protein
MSTFFSGTDLNTLLEEGMDRNHFVSLIVNNDGKYSAAITRKITYNRTVEDYYNYNSFNDTPYSNKRIYTIEGSEVEYYPLIVDMENGDYSVLQSRLDSIAESKKKNNLAKNSFTTISPTTTINPIYKDITEPELFDWDYIDNKEVYNMYNYKLSKESIQSLVMQLLTGCITISNNSKLDINKWVSNMEKVFDNRFGKNGENSDLFSAWADSFIENICWYSNTEETQKIYDDGVKASIIAKNIKESLEKLPKNKYIIAFIKILQSYELE